jgi:triosephosphate isomerase (TIM)
MRRELIAGNWKMYKTVKETVQFIEEFKPLVKNSDHCDIAIAPPFTALAEAVKRTEGTNIAVAAQNLFWEPEGAYTGEISAPMLVEVGCVYVIIGHSERRQYFGETNLTIKKKIRASMAAKLTPIVCFGEALAEREANRTHHVIQTQFNERFTGLTVEDFSRIIISYEPVWAIGTGHTATPEIAAEVQQYIRRLARDNFGQVYANNLRILYGGSVRPENIRELIEHEDIDGALVGGASLKADSFASIINFGS